MANSAGIDFARQLAERNASLNPTATKRFRSAPAPKGTKLGPGYQDRTQFRTSAEDDEKARRVKALEDMVKLGQMEMATFEALRDEIVGGDVKNVHLVKGLDWKLLERVRRGEDVLADASAPIKSDAVSQTSKEDHGLKTDVELEDELERYEGKEIQPVAKSNKTKKGEMAPPAAVAGRKRNRDEILKELKASRSASAKQPSLGPRFTKVGEAKDKSRIEKDGKGRDVLITVDEEGRIKRKVRKSKGQTNSPNPRELLMPDKNVEPLGMEVLPVAHSAPDVSDNGDIFEGAGTEYNPLGDLEGDEGDDSGDSDMSDSSSEEVHDAPSTNEPRTDNDSNHTPEPIPARDSVGATPDSPALQPAKSPRNYSNDSDALSASTQAIPPSDLDTSTFLAALKKASSISLSAATSEPDVAKKLEQRRKMLQGYDRDADDLDMGFGGSRFEDEEDGDEGRVKLSVWGQEGGGEGEDSRKGKRKRGGKKRKGDVNSAVDVLRVMEQRKQADGGSGRAVKRR